MSKGGIHLRSLSNGIVYNSLMRWSYSRSHSDSLCWGWDWSVDCWDAVFLFRHPYSDASRSRPLMTLSVCCVSRTCETVRSECLSCFAVMGFDGSGCGCTEAGWVSSGCSLVGEYRIRAWLQSVSHVTQLQPSEAGTYITTVEKCDVEGYVESHRSWSWVLYAGSDWLRCEVGTVRWVAEFCFGQSVRTTTSTSRSS